MSFLMSKLDSDSDASSLAGACEPLLAVGWLVLVVLNGSLNAEDRAALEKLPLFAQTIKNTALRDASIMEFI